MGVISFKQSGGFSNLRNYLSKNRDSTFLSLLRNAGSDGVRVLSASTPTDSGKTASAWGFEIEQQGNVYRLIFTNSNINQGVPIAVLIQYGHGTGTGGYVQGIDYINPALKPIFEKLSSDLSKEVK